MHRHHAFCAFLRVVDDYATPHEEGVTTSLPSSITAQKFWSQWDKQYHLVVFSFQVQAPSCPERLRKDLPLCIVIIIIDFVTPILLVLRHIECGHGL